MCITHTNRTYIRYLQSVQGRTNGVATYIRTLFLNSICAFPKSAHEYFTGRLFENNHEILSPTELHVSLSEVQIARVLLRVSGIFGQVLYTHRR